MQFRIDKLIKAQVLDVCKRLGLDLSSYLRMCMSRLAQENEIPFSMQVNPVYENIEREAKNLAIGLADDEVDAEAAGEGRKVRY